MIDLILVGAFTAFFMAALEPAISFINIFIDGRLTAIVLSLSFSTLGTYLLSTRSLKSFLLTAVAGAFLGNFFVAVGERIATHRPTIVNPTK